MHKYVQRGLLAVVASGGFVLLGQAVASADTAPTQPAGLDGVVNSVSTMLGGSHQAAGGSATTGAASATGNTTSGATAGNGGNSGNGGAATSTNTATSGNS